MTVKKYLEEINTDREYIRQLKIRRENIHINYNGITGIDYSGDKVQSSPTDKLFDKACEMYERMEEIDKKIASVTLRIDNKLSEIHKVGGAYAQILFMRYYDNMSLEDIADVLKRDYHYICTLNGEALKKFGELHPFSELAS